MFSRYALEYSFHNFNIPYLSRIHFQWITVQDHQVCLFPNLNGSHFVLNAENLSCGGGDAWVKWYLTTEFREYNLPLMAV